MTALIIGDHAPDFSLYDTDKTERSLSDFRGQNVVVLFFPLAFTSTCTAELCGVRDDIAFYQNLNVPVLAISVDTVFSLARFKEDQNLNMILLSDFNQETCKAYGSMYETFILGMTGVAKRSAFVIDKNGVVRYAEVLENAGEIPNLDAVKQTLNQLA
ncbi:MAG: redoxin domain-containing protein [Bacteroidetes bacterium]|nr:redoxin domain-containing protein [Bacteroidota bacterium]